MARKPKSENGENFDDRIVVAVQKPFKKSYTALCAEAGEVPSERIRMLLVADELRMNKALHDK